jgi:aspartyl-tRNA(Asn)/glutamyl-tRNA(Gln) amidotransferase subunit A
MDGKRMSANDFIAIQRGRHTLIARLNHQLQGRILVTPTTPITAPELAPLEANDDTFHAVNLLALRNTMPGNILNLCGVALPNGEDGDGMPTSILFSAPHGDDEKLLAVAVEIERVLAEAAAR